MQLNVSCRKTPTIVKVKREIIMLEFYEPGVAIVDSIAKMVGRATTTNGRLVDFMFGVQKAMLGELIFVGTEIFDRARTETQLFSEFSSKMAASHSVKDLETMCRECGQHQIDFIRRDSERIFKHGERMIETAANLFNSRPQA